MDISSYSGQRGLYVSAHSRYGPRLPFLAELGPDVERDLHVTLMWSRAGPPRASLSELRSVLSRPLEVELKRLAWISGYDGVGYLVAELNSVEAHDRHDLLVKIGCVPHWTTFYPHMTLMKGLSKKQAVRLTSNINERLARKPVKIELTSTICTDLR